MNVKELKQIIKDLPDDMRVTVDGYEGGISDIQECGVLPIYVNYNVDESYLGDHEETYYQYDDYDEEAFQLRRVQ